MNLAILWEKPFAGAFREKNQRQFRPSRPCPARQPGTRARGTPPLAPPFSDYSNLTKMTHLPPWHVNRMKSLKETTSPQNSNPLLPLAKTMPEVQFAEVAPRFAEEVPHSAQVVDFAPQISS